MPADIVALLALWVADMYLLLSIVTFFVYRSDKLAAVARRWRTPESTLLLLGLLGGWPGGAVAQQVFRHKRRKRSFQLRFWLTVLVNVAAAVWLVWAAPTF